MVGRKVHPEKHLHLLLEQSPCASLEFRDLDVDFLSLTTIFHNTSDATMETADLHELVGDLTSNIDDLESALAALTQKPLTTTSSKLPLLDKAKLYVLATYALESILFNSLRLNGTDAKAHPVFAELNRVKEYFGKIKTVEGTGGKPTSRVDKDAAGRFIKAGLAGNDRFDRERQEKSAREKAGAKRKLDGLSVGTHTRLDGAAKRIKAADEESSAPSRANTHDHSEEDGDKGVALGGSGTEQNPKRKNKLSDEAKKEEKRARRRQAKEAKLSPHEAPADVEEEGPDSQPTGKSSQAPKSSKEALDSLLSGASSKLEKKGRREKKKSKGQALEDERAGEMK